MARSSGGSGPIAWAPGNQNCDYAVLFDETSTSITSHEFAVDNNFVRIAAFNLTAGEVITIEQITGLGAGSLIADYAPVSGPVRLYYNSATDQRTSYVLERPGRYRAKLTSGELGLITVYAVRYYVENEASQDIADALFAVLKEFQKPFNPCTAGAVIPVDTTANNDVVSLNDSDCLVHQQLMSSVAGNLLQLKTDGLYYGITPPPNFVNQYVSSSTGNDTNPGTQLLPLRTIQKALSNLPDGTAGNIFLLAGDVFHTYPTATGDVINTLTFNQGAAQANTLNIGNRTIQVFPYNDVAINAIENYNTANVTGYNPFIAQQTNFPEIRVTLSQSTDNGGIYFVLGFIVGTLGSIRFNACKFIMGSTGGNTTNFFHSGIVGNGLVSFQGGYVVLSEIPAIGNATGAAQMDVTVFQTPVLVDTSFAFQPRYAILGNQILMVTSTPITSGNLIVPALTYTNTGDTMEQTGGFPSTTPLPGASYDYVALGGAGSEPLWENIVIYDHTVRAYRRLFTSIDVQA